MQPLWKEVWNLRLSFKIKIILIKENGYLDHSD